jgi:hypothetical protein
MKKVLFIFTIIIPFISFSQESKITGEWEMYKIEVNGETKNMNEIVIFEPDKDIIMRDNFFGTWNYNTKENKLEQKMLYNQKMSGVYKIKKITTTQMILEKDKATIYYKKHKN